MSDTTPVEKRSDTGSVVYSEAIGADDPLLRESHVVLTEIPQGL